MKGLASILVIILIALISCGDNSQEVQYDTEFVTFIELGSVDCDPCIAMQPIMKSLEDRYGDQLKVEFIDVVYEHSKAEPYNVVVMPTQVFLNDKGQEIHRHIGFYPENEIDEFLYKCGLTPDK